MTGNEVKAIKLLAQHFNIEPKGYNPLENQEQAEHAIRELGITVDRPMRFVGGYQTNTATFIEANHNGEVIYRINGTDEAVWRLAAVYGACEVIHPGWRDKPMFGIPQDSRAPEYAARYVDAADPE